MANTIIPLKELRVDAVLPVAIYDGQNSHLMLLNRGMVLTTENIQTLQRRGISRIAVDSRFVKEIWSAPATGRPGIQLQQHYLAEQRRKAELKNQALTKRLIKPTLPQYDHTLVADIAAKHSEHERSLEVFLEAMATKQRLRGEVVQMVAHDSIEHMLADVDLFVKMALVEGQHESVHQHCLRVAKLAMSIATILEHREDEIRQLGIGCLLSRVGMNPTIKELTQSPRQLTTLEVLELKKYPGHTWNALEQISDLPVGARQVAWQINERWNGSGYPRGRSEKQIHPLARIAAVADVFIALTSSRPYRAAFGAHEAVRIILEDTRNGLYDPQAVRGLLQTVSLFPLGSYVELSNSLIAITVRNDSQKYDRPTVQVICDNDGRRQPEKYLDLVQCPDLHIVRTHAPTEIERLMQHRESLDQCWDVLSGQISPSLDT